MTIRNIEEQDLIQMVGLGSSSGNVVGMSRGKAAVLFYTPFCGTCQIAERMLEVVQATTLSIPLFKLNINYAPRLRDEWKISSIPCLAILQDGQPLRLEYAMRSVDHLYKLLKEID